MQFEDANSWPVKTSIGLKGRLWRRLWEHLSACSTTLEKNVPINTAKASLECAKDNAIPSGKKIEELELGENGTKV